MKKIIILTLFLFTSVAMKAHQPNVSTTMLVEKENNVWVLQISASLTAFQQEINTHFSETPYKTPEEFQKMVIEHIKNNLEIKFNQNHEITLGKGFVKLGHEAKVVFEVFGVPSEINTVFVKNSAFKDIHKNQSALVLLKEGFNKEHFVLNDKNNHTLNLIVDENKFVIKTKNQASFFSLNMFYILLGLIIIGLLTKLLKMKSIKN
ncbi:hypothetical protein [uncultured Lacinutrix sp.]|uniref:hypothetical protein n=1 Tax=uncultured Lacinutrix sp. TaxID=574032 RepID=UPI0026228658|nr:hypothetical protein [uncultured Lacinutrix sp.]